MTKFKIVFCYQDLRTSGKDFVLTPFLFGVWNKKFRALSICLWWHAICIGIAYNPTKKLKRFYKL